MNTVETPSDSLSPAAKEMRPPGGHGFIFSTPELNQRLDLLGHLVANSARIPLVKGLSGSGKSTLLSRFLQTRPAEWVTCRVDAHPLIQPDQLYKHLADCFRLPAGEQLSPEALFPWLEEMEQQGNIPVLVVDDAHLLPPATFEALLGLHLSPGRDRVQLRIVLFALPVVDAVLDTPALHSVAQQAFQALELLPLSRERTEQMTLQLIRVAGYSDSLEFTVGQLDQVFDESQGLPGEIKKSVEIIVKQGQLKPQTPKSSHKWMGWRPDVSAASMMVGTVLVVLIGSLLIYQDEVNQLVSESAGDDGPRGPGTAPTEVISLRLPELGSREEQTPPANPQSVSIGSNSGEEDRAFGQEVSKAEFGLTAGGSLPNGEKVKSDSAIPPEAVTDQSSKRIEEEPPGEVSGVQQDTPNPAAALEVSDESRPIDAARTDKQSEPDHEPVTGGGTQRPPEVPDTPKVVKIDRPEPKPARKSGSGTPSRGKIKGESWLMGQNPKRFTLQLIGVGEEKGLRKFVRKHRLSGDLAYFRTLRDGKPWFSLVMGIYPSRAAAVAARKKLPRALGKSGAWPRTLGSIQEAIRAR
ncbi:MAG: AAA family ATPase [Gammaproteobacteria bacterium]|nr:AAA family ATPase [Gammaproteobacteria bacterium]